MSPAVFWVSWNLMLAVLPVFFGWRMATRLRQAREGRPGLWPAVVLWSVLWLAFLPNTCYLLTEWRHWFDEIHTGEYWLRWKHDASLPSFLALAQWTVFYACFAGAGVVAFWAAVRPVASTLRGWRPLPAAGTLLFWLNGLGVYLGLELRFNSWDLIHRPGIIVGQAVEALRHPVFVVMVTAFAVGLWVLYETIETFAVGWRQRFREKVAG